MTPEEFLRKHNMYYGQMSFPALVEAYVEEMEAGLAGRPSTLYMLPSYIPAGAEPRRGEHVLVLDAGGTNLRSAQMHFDAQGRPVVEHLKKRHMPGFGGAAIQAEELFRQMAAFALEAAEGCRYACISFSYPCRVRPDGDGEILGLCKELEVRGAEGRLVCASLEAALEALGAGGHRRWRLINDSAGSLLGGMAMADRSAYDDYIGFILGTGTNACACFPAAWIAKDPAAAAMGGETIVNLEAGCFGRVLLGDVDRALDAASDLPGDHLAEKMVSGSYYRQVLERTLLLAVREGELPAGAGERLRRCRINSAMIDAFCLDPMGDNPLGNALDTPQARAFGAGVNDALLERAAQISGACLCAIVEKRALPPGSRVGVCADGTMLRLNPRLRPGIERYLESYARKKLGVTAEFLFAEDATLLGCAWAGLIDG